MLLVSEDDEKLWTHHAQQVDDAGREGWELVGIAANNFAYLKRLSATDAVEPPPKQRARRKSTT